MAMQPVTSCSLHPYALLLPSGETSIIPLLCSLSQYVTFSARNKRGPYKKNPPKNRELCLTVRPYGRSKKEFMYQETRWIWGLFKDSWERGSGRGKSATERRWRFSCSKITTVVSWGAWTPPQITKRLWLMGTRGVKVIESIRQLVGSGACSFPRSIIPAAAPSLLWTSTPPLPRWAAPSFHPSGPVLPAPSSATYLYSLYFTTMQVMDLMASALEEDWGLWGTGDFYRDPSVMMWWPQPF